MCLPWCSSTGETPDYRSGYGAEEEYEGYRHKDIERSGTAKKTLAS